MHSGVKPTIFFILLNMESLGPDKEKELKDKLNRIGGQLQIDRVPRKTISWLKNLAFEEFCGDYGMALKHICDFYQGMIPVGTEHLEMDIEYLRTEIQTLKNKMAEKPEEKGPPKKKTIGERIAEQKQG